MSNAPTPSKQGNPAVVGLAGFGLTTLLLQFHEVGWSGLGPVVWLGLVFGGAAAETGKQNRRRREASGGENVDASDGRCRPPGRRDHFFSDLVSSTIR